MSARSSETLTQPAAIVAADPAKLRFGDSDTERRCLYVEVESRSRPEVAEFLACSRRCCRSVSIDWRTLRRPASALVGIELQGCCTQAPTSLRLVFDVRRDRQALETLVATETLVVGNRPYGRFANSMVACGVDGRLLRSAMQAAERRSKRAGQLAS